MACDKKAVRKVLDQAKAAGRSALTAPEAKGICEAYGIAVPQRRRHYGRGMRRARQLRSVSRWS